MSAKVIYDTGAMQVMAHFERMTHARLKDCIMREQIVFFIVEPGSLGKAIGPKGAHVRKMEQALKKKVKMVEFAPELVSFIKNLVYPVDIKDVREEDGIVFISPPDLKSRGLLIGRNAQTLRAYEAVVQRFFTIKELRIANYG